MDESHLRADWHVCCPVDDPCDRHRAAEPRTGRGWVADLIDKHGVDEAGRIIDWIMG